MTYTAHRDMRFHYASDVIHFIEDRQCGDCAFRNPGVVPMCDEIAVGLIVEEPVEALDDLGVNGVVCRKYRNEILVEQEHSAQGRLFNA